MPPEQPHFPSLGHRRANVRWDTGEGSEAFGSPKDGSPSSGACPDRQLHARDDTSTSGAGGDDAAALDDGFIEPICRASDDRFVLFPIEHSDLWRMYKQHEASFWTAEEIDLGPDRKDWERLNDSERHFISHVLAFFASSDGIVVENLAERFCRALLPPRRRHHRRGARVLRSAGRAPAPSPRAPHLPSPPPPIPRVRPQVT